MLNYAYIHARPDGTPFYVGKGRGKRATIFSPGYRSKHHGNVVAKHGRKNILIGKIECSSEPIAFDLERGLIKCLRRSGVELVNHTDGGEGASGNKNRLGKPFSEESKAKISAGLRKHFAENGSASTGRKLSPEHLVKMALTKVGNKNRLGKTFSEESKAKISAGLKKHFAENGSHSKGRKLSPEHLAKMALTKVGNKNRLGKTFSEESKAKISASLRAYQERKRNGA